MNPYNFKLTAADGAVYAVSTRYGWKDITNCSERIALPTDGTRACGLWFELPSKTRGRATLSWGRLHRPEATTTLVIGEEALDPQAAALALER
jgi:hypothetical protein